nr:ABC transporter ATP-binding protein [bacterium]
MGIYKPYYKKYKIPFFIAMACVAMEALCDLMGPTLMARIIDEGIEGGDMGRVLFWGALMLGITAAGADFAIARNILASRVSQRVGADLRLDLFRKIMRFSEGSVDQIESGSLITRMTNDTNQVVLFINGIMRIFLKAPITCIGSIVLSTLLNFRLSLIVYTVVAVVAGLIMISMKLSYPRFAKLQQAMDRVNSVVQEYLIGVRLVKAFGTYGQETKRFEKANQQLYTRGVASQIIITYISPLLTLTVGLGTAAVILLGSRLFPAGLAGAGDISAFTIYMAQILSSLLIITNVFNTFVRTKASTARIRQILDCGEDFAPQGVRAPLSGAIVFEDVTFAYPGGSGVPAIEHVSFTWQPGQSLALIGPTGSGKSTLAWLLLRFYDVTSGRILIDGLDIRQYDVAHLRSQIALVPQKAMLFSGSVADNLKWGKPSATPQEMEDALSRAQAGFVSHMPGGLDSALGSGGVNLSGGQKQRLSIARGLVKDAPVLILDDATSALDAVTEARVRARLLSPPQRRSTLLITQRCTSAMFCDRILVMDEGRCVGFGTHEQLMQSCQMYRDIYHSQLESAKEA